MDNTTNLSTISDAPDPNLGREWNSPFGRQKIALRLAYPTGDLYEVATIGEESVRRYSVNSIDDVIERNEYALTPEHAAERRAALEKTIQVSQAAAVQRAKAQADDEKLTAYTDAHQYTAMQAGQAKKVLSALVRYQGAVCKVFEMIDDLVGSGYSPVTSKVDRIKPMNRRAFHRADNNQQREHDRKVAAAGKKNVYEMRSAEGSIYDIGAFGYDYAQYLLDQHSETKSAA